MNEPLKERINQSKKEWVKENVNETENEWKKGARESDKKWKRKYRIWWPSGELMSFLTSSLLVSSIVENFMLVMPHSNWTNLYPEIQIGIIKNWSCQRNALIWDASEI